MRIVIIISIITAVRIPRKILNTTLLKKSMRCLDGQPGYCCSRLTGALFVVGVALYLYRNVRKTPFAMFAVVGSVALLATGYFASIYSVVILVKYWFVPLATWGIFANQIRGFAEHYPEDEFRRSDEVPHVFRTRDVINSSFDQAFLVTRGVNYHLSHHLCPQIPFYNLGELQTELSKSPVYQQHAHVTSGYHQFLIEYFFKRPAVVGAESVMTK